MLHRVPSTIRIPDVTLASRPPPTTPSALLFFPPPSPTTATGPTLAGSFLRASIWIQTRSNSQRCSHLEICSSARAYPRYPPFCLFSGAGLPAPPWICRHAHGSSSQFLFTTILRRSGSLVCWPVTRGSGSALDAASHLRDFHALIDEMRATLLHHDSKEEFDAGNQCDDEGDER